VPTGLNFTASGLAYWSSDTGGWQWPIGPKAEHPVLVDPAGATAMAPDYTDYPELFVRWFEYNTFTPTLRIHGQRPATAIWDYGKAAEPVLAKILKLRYALIPYLYALGRQTYETGTPFMRGRSSRTRQTGPCRSMCKAPDLQLLRRSASVSKR